MSSVADAPPHGLGIEHDGFPEGCPTGNDPLVACRSMVENGIVLYCVGCEPAIMQYRDFFMGLAFKTGGQYVPLSRAQALSKVRRVCVKTCQVGIGHYFSWLLFNAHQGRARKIAVQLSRTSRFSCLASHFSFSLAQWARAQASCLPTKL